MSKDQPIIIVRKRAHAAHGHHGGAWKVAYADFVTALMAFFLVMWLVSQSPKVRAAVAGYFRDPGAFDTTQTSGVLPGGSEGLRDLGVTPSSLPEDVRAAREVLERAAEHLRQALAKMPSLESLRERIEISVTAEGLRIELLEHANRSFFAVGSAEPLPETIELLSVIARELGALPNTVALEGHTDSRAYTSAGGYGNWELSTDRANAARRVMARHGLHAGQFDAVRGFADTRLRHPEDPLDARNRRVSIVVHSEIRAGAPPARDGAARRPDVAARAATATNP